MGMLWPWVAIATLLPVAIAVVVANLIVDVARAKRKGKP